MSLGLVHFLGRAGNGGKGMPIGIDGLIKDEGL